MRLLIFSVKTPILWMCFPQVYTHVHKGSEMSSPLCISMMCHFSILNIKPLYTLILVSQVLNWEY